MDYTLSNFEELQIFMRDLLDKAIQGSQIHIEIDDMFAGDGFAQLCLASGGVPRDFLSLFVSLGGNIGNTKQIGKMDVNDSAIANVTSKLESMKRDSGDADAILENYLARIKQHVFKEKRTNTFLIGKDELDENPAFKQAVRELVDLRLIHLVNDNTSKAPSDGRRYEAYILDVGLYDNSRPRNFTQIEPGLRDEKSRKDDLRSSPLIDLKMLTEISNLETLDKSSGIKQIFTNIESQGKLPLSYE